MAFPLWKSVGTSDAATGAVTPGLPASWAAGDFFLLFVESYWNEAVATPSGWTVVTGSPVANGTPSGTDTATRLSVFYRRAQGGDTAPTVADSGNHTLAIIHAFTGVKTAGDPFTDTSTGWLNAPDTAVVVPGVTVNSEHHLLVVAVATGWDAATSIYNNDAANTDAPSIPRRSGTQTNLGNGGGLGIYTGGIGIDTGTTGDTTLSLTGSSWQAYMAISLAPAELSKSSSDTGSGADNQTAAAATLSEGDTGSGAEASTIAATLSDADTGSGAEASTITATPPTETDTGSGAEASSITASFTDADTGSGADAESLVVNLSDGDTGAGVDGGESIEGMDEDIDDADTGTGTEDVGAFGITDVGDTGSGAEDSTIVVSLSDADTGSGVEDSTIVASFTDTDTGSGLDDNNAIDQVLSDGDTGSGVDDGSITSVLLSDGDTGTGVDAESVPSATLSDDDPASAGDSQSLDTGAPIIPRRFTVSFGGRLTGVEEVARTNIPYCIAHRGGPDDYGPENLLSTCVEAATAGASIEIDVRHSSDGTAWLMHDWDVDRTTNGTGGIINLTDAYLNGLVADGTGGLEGIPTLLEVLNAVEGINSFSKVIIHYNAGVYSQANIESIQDDIDTSGMAGRIIFSSWLAEHLEAFYNWADPDIERMQILTTGEDWYPSIYQTSILVGDYDDLTLQAVQEAQATGLVVHASVGSDQGYRKIMTTGVTSNMTDAPEAYWTWLGKYQTGSV